MTLDQDIQVISNKVFETDKTSRLSIDRTKLDKFIKDAINGDKQVSSYVVFNATLPGNKDGIAAYILTNSRLLRIRITKDGFESTDFFLNQINGINRRLLNKPDGSSSAEVRVESPGGYFGLEYDSSDVTINKFFSEAESAVRQAKAGT